MATTTQHQQAHVGIAGAEGTRAAPEHGGRPTAARLTTEQVWRQLVKASFAVLGHVTPAGEPRSSGVVYKTVGQRLYIAIAPDSWKARHIAVSRRVAVTVPVRRGGLLSLVLPIPPATISFHGTAIVHPADSPQVRSLLNELASLLPEERRASAAVIEVIPEGSFVTYGVGVSLAQMRDPAAARARVSVTQEGNWR
jgi:pyridoxamine 5'-phosphate oxidase-like protein